MPHVLPASSFFLLTRFPAFFGSGSSDSDSDEGEGGSG